MAELEVQFLPAREGDAIWIRWPADPQAEDSRSHQMLIDMGVSQTGKDIAQRLLHAPEDQRTFELLVVTHVDRDHIAGVLSCVVDPDQRIPGLRSNDIWFNGRPHLSGDSVPVVSSNEPLTSRFWPRGTP